MSRNEHLEDPSINLEDVSLDVIQYVSKEDRGIKKKAEERKDKLFVVKVRGVFVGYTNDPNKLPARTLQDRFDHWQIYAVRGNTLTLVEGNNSNGNKPFWCRVSGHPYE